MIDAQSGRAAAIARRVALSAGKTALPPATERVRDGQRSASTPRVAAAPGGPVPASPSATDGRAVMVVAAPAPPPARVAVASPGMTGRAASLERRRQLSAGKAAAGVSPQPPMPPLSDMAGSGSGREVSRARRIALSQTGRTDTPPNTSSSGPGPGIGKLVYAPKVVESTTGSGQRVTGSRIGRGQSVTGDERGTIQPVSGTQYVEPGAGGAWRGAGTKVGFAKTAGGLTVSGTLVRSAVAITGDEAAGATMTGRVDQSPTDDLTTRPHQGASVSGQYARPAGARAVAFAGGASAGRGAGGSRERQRDRAAEATGGGAVITGSALCHSKKVTGDQGGPSRNVTGNRFMAPTRRQAEAGAAMAQPMVEPAATPKAVALSLNGQRISGLDVEHNQRVTGDAPGSCAALTGSQYQGPATTETYCGADTATRRRMRARAGKAVTGDTPLHADGVTGTGRGADRDITGTRYFCAGETPEAAPANPVAALDSQFSIRTPQRSAQLAPPRAATGEDRITGSFAAGGGKLTGNVEFQVRRRASEASRPGASTLISGEGSVQGAAITGSSWTNNSRVTGVDGSFAAARNPTQQGQAAKPFAGATSFKAKAKPEETSQLVTGSFSKTGARVTLSGGAQT